MILDNDLVFSATQTVTETADSTKTIDTKLALNTTGVNEPQMNIVLLFPQLMAGTSPTLKVELKESDDNSSFTAVEGCSTSAMDGTALKDVVLRMPMTHKRYLKLAYTCGGTVSTGAKIEAFMTTSLDAQQYYSEEDGSFQ